MKKIVLFFALLLITASAMNQVKVANNGCLGVGTNNPTYKLDLKGNARFSLYGQGWEDIFIDGANQWGAPQLYCKTQNFMLGNQTYIVNAAYINWLYYYNTYKMSDEKLKENIKPLENTLSKLLKIDGKSYQYKRDSDVGGITGFEELARREQFGFIAQELEKIFPELVLPPNPTNNYYSVDYVGMIPVLVEAIKEQQTIIENQQNKIEILQNIVSNQEIDLIELQAIRSDILELQKKVSICCNNSNPLQLEEPQLPQEKAILFQNAPNPFSSNTEISCYLPETAQQAIIYIYNLQGSELKAYPVTRAGLNTIIVNGSELPAGMYLYTLVADNEIIDSKRMILTK